MSMYTDENPGMSEYYRNHPKSRKGNVDRYGRDLSLPENHWKWTALVVVVWLIVAMMSIGLISQRNCMPTDMVQALQGECEPKIDI